MNKAPFRRIKESVNYLKSIGGDLYFLRDVLDMMELPTMARRVEAIAHELGERAITMEMAIREIQVQVDYLLDKVKEK